MPTSSTFPGERTAPNRRQKRAPENPTEASSYHESIACFVCRDLSRFYPIRPSESLHTAAEREGSHAGEMGFAGLQVALLQWGTAEVDARDFRRRLGFCVG